jgi:hypothetical protein
VAQGTMQCRFVVALEFMCIDAGAVCSVAGGGVASRHMLPACG